MEVGFQLFNGRAISVVKYFHYHQGPSIVRCVASNLLPIIVKVPKCQMICFSLETSALSKLLLWHCHVHSRFSSMGARGRVTGDSSTWSQPAFPSHSPQCSVTGRRATESVLDEWRLSTTSVDSGDKVTDKVAFLEREENIWVPCRLTKPLPQSWICSMDWCLSNRT